MLDDYENYKVTFIFVCDECGYKSNEYDTPDLPDGWIQINAQYIMCPECVAD